MEKKSNAKKVQPKRFIPQGSSRKSFQNRPAVAKTRPNPFLLRENQAERQRPIGSNVLNQIRRQQNSTQRIIPKACFQRLVKQICNDLLETSVRWTSLGMQALQTSAEGYMIGLFEDSYLCALHAKRVTLLSKDMQLARRIRGLGDPGNR